jgi:hypothetical protein
VFTNAYATKFVVPRARVGGVAEGPVEKADGLPKRQAMQKGGGRVAAFAVRKVGVVDGESRAVTWGRRLSWGKGADMLRLSWKRRGQVAPFGQNG